MLVQFRCSCWGISSNQVVEPQSDVSVVKRSSDGGPSCGCTCVSRVVANEMRWEGTEKGTGLVVSC